MNEMSGGCLCGAVTFTASDVETDYHACHCGMCRRWSGGPFLGASAGRVRFEGEENVSVYDSSKWAERGFCTRCGSGLFFRVKSPAQYVMCVGAFDDAAAFRLVGEIYVDRKAGGYDFAGDLPRQTEAEFLEELRRGQ
jgi:hypothetical protein